MNSDRILLLAGLIALAGCSPTDIDWSKVTVCNDAGACSGAGKDGIGGGAEGGAGDAAEPPGAEDSVLRGGTGGGSSRMNGDSSHDLAGAGGSGGSRAPSEPSGGVGGTSKPGAPSTGAAGADEHQTTSAGGAAAPPAPRCGDGHVDSGELCDGNCLSQCSPPAAPIACLASKLTGSPEHCDVQCMSEAITTCVSGDGCCPSACTHASDTDCSTKCGDGVVDPGEKCDPPSSCSTTCDDHDPCTTDMLVGSASTCSAECVHQKITTPKNGDSCCPDGANANVDSDCKAVCGNGVKERGELCDGNCSTSCSSADACHPGKLEGSASTCDAVCSTTAITAALGGDGCCPPGANANTDSDCTPMCGNGVLERGEACERGAPSKGQDGLPAGTLYDEWNCAANCQRLHVLTPCDSDSACGPDAPVCQTYHRCSSHCTFSSGNAASCSLPNGHQGVCNAPDSCVPVCQSDSDCPATGRCVMLSANLKLCDIQSP